MIHSLIHTTGGFRFKSIQLPSTITSVMDSVRNLCYIHASVDWQLNPAPVKSG